MGLFEQDLRLLLTRDDLAHLLATLTLDGSRQWAFYTSDGHACAHRVSRLTCEAKCRPIEMIAGSDSSWSFIRTGIFVHAELVAVKRY